MPKTIDQVEAMKAKLIQGSKGIRVSAEGTNDWIDEIIESVTASAKDLSAHVDHHPDQKAELIPILQRQVDLALRMVTMRGDVVGGQPPKGPVDSGGQSEDDGRMDARLTKLESVAEKTQDRLAAIEQDVAVIKSNYATKADISALESTLLKWFIATAVTMTGLAFTIAKFVH